MTTETQPRPRARCSNCGTMFDHTEDYIGTLCARCDPTLAEPEATAEAPDSEGEGGENLDPPEPPNGSGAMCDLCGNMFKSAAGVATHKRTAHVG